MDILGVGPFELALILLIVFLVIGPNDLAATGKKIGRFLSTLKKSEFWKGVSQISKEVRTLPTTLMREAELEDLKKEMEQDANSIKNLSKEFEVDVPEWRKSAQKEFSAQQKNEKSSPATDAEPTSEPAPPEVAVEEPTEAASPEPEEPAPTEEEKE
ncbi:hypothetical protein KQH61_04005 [bacterium]|nr:hypothetical protein [bacterium]MCB2179066.1 hypothetical protein [bacterium]